METPPKIFSGTGSQYLAEKIAHKFGVPLGKITISKFSDGEIQPVFQESIRGSMVFLVQSTYSPAENILELLLMIDAAKRASAYKVVAVLPYVEQLQLENLTFAAPDVGSANRIREIATYFNAEMVICDKHRKRANEIASMVVIGDVTGRDIVLIDDICDTGGTLAKAAGLLTDKGASSVRALCTHAVLSGSAY